MRWKARKQCQGKQQNSPIIPTLERFRKTRSQRREHPDMPATSAAQQKAAGAALSAKRGVTPKSKLKGASKLMVESMSATELKKTRLD
jgi:hypothetical protein